MLLQDLQDASVDYENLGIQYEALIESLLAGEQRNPQQVLRHVHAFYSAVSKSTGGTHAHEVEHRFMQKLSTDRPSRGGELLLVLVALTVDHKLRLQVLSRNGTNIGESISHLLSMEMSMLMPNKQYLWSADSDRIESCLKKEGGLYVGERQAIEVFYKSLLAKTASSDLKALMSSRLPSKKRTRKEIEVDIEGNEM